MANMSVAGSKVSQDLTEILVPRLPQMTKEDQDSLLNQSHEDLEARMAPLHAKFNEIRERYKPGTMMIIDVLGNITTLDPSSSLLETILEVAHFEAHGRAEACIFKV